MEKNNKEEEFIISFEDDVIDMTDMNRVRNNNTGYYSPGAGGYNQTGAYGAYNSPGTYDAYNQPGAYSQSGTYGQSDIYGVYQPDRIEQAKRISAGRKANLENVMTRLLYAVMLLEILYFAYFVITKNYDYRLYTSLSAIINIIVELVFVVDACMMYGRYKKVSLLVSVFLMPIVYPMVRNSARSESKSISGLWLLLIFILAIIMAKEGIPEMAFSIKADTTGKEIYLSKYKEPMKKFKEYKYDGKTKTSDIINKWFLKYEIDVISEEDGFLNVKIAGNTTTQIYGVVTPDKSISPNTIMYFKVNKENGSYKITGLQINGEVYHSYAKDVWKYWYANY